MLRQLARKFVTTVGVSISIVAVPTPAEAQLFKCKDSSGNMTYKNEPCVRSEGQDTTGRQLAPPPRRTNAVPKRGEPGLWEMVTVIHARASHPDENPWQKAPREELEKAGDYKYFLGVPMKTQECKMASPIEAMLGQLKHQCARQIEARGGECKTSDSVRGMSGTQEVFSTITGDYRSELHVNNRITQGKDDTGKPVYDDSEKHVRYLGACKADMRPGEVFLVKDDGSLVKQR